MSARNKHPSITRTSSAKNIPLHLLSSPSRAYTAPKKGEKSLLDTETQERYRALIQGKIEEFLSRYPLPQDGTVNNTTEAKEMGSNILLLFRKLREGIVASSRADDFALEVYETSACWSCLLNDDAQSTSVLSQIPDMHRKFRERGSVPKATTSEPGSLTRSQTVALLQALHLLRLHHPSQMDFRAHLISSDMVPAVYRSHVSSVATALRRNTYARLHSLTDPNSHPLLQDLPKEAIHIKALLASFGRIRDLARPQAWRCLHAAYREVSSKEEVGTWLSRSLLLKQGPDQLSEWMESKSKSGETIKKAGDGGGGWTFVRQTRGKS